MLARALAVVLVPSMVPMSEIAWVLVSVELSDETWELRFGTASAHSMEKTMVEMSESVSAIPRAAKTVIQKA